MTIASVVPSSRGAWLFESEVTLAFRGPLHVGTGERLSLGGDAPLLRDGTGDVWLPGASIRGVLRDWCEREAPLVGVGTDALVRLFGATPSRKDQVTEDRQGRLRVFDAKVGRARTEIRDHVRIDRHTGAAARGGKFDLESADVHLATFRLSYEGDSENDHEVRLLQAALAALSDGVLAFGAKVGWGLGAAELLAPGPKPKRVDRGTPAGCASYLASRLGGAPLPEGPPLSKPTYETAPVSIRSARAPWSWLKLQLRLQFDGPMLAAGMYRERPNSGLEKAADATFIVGLDGRPVLPGSALRGALRSHAERVAKTLGAGAEGAAQALFGYVTLGGRDARRGLLTVGEGRLDGEPRVVFMNHVAIDRVTGFAADKKLFDAAALASPAFTTSVFARWHDNDGDLDLAAIGLLLLVLRDAQQGQLWIGSRTTRGYGWLRRVDIEHGMMSRVTGQSPASGRPPTPVSLPDGLLAHGDGVFEDFLKAWRNHAGITEKTS